MATEANSVFKFTDLSVFPALSRYAVAQGLRGKDLMDIVRKAMRYYVSFSIKKIPKGDPNKIRGELTAIVRTHERLERRNVRSKSAAANVWRGTLASKIVFALDWQGAKVMAAFGDYEGSYRKAALFTGRRVFAAGLHRSGLREAIYRLRAGSGIGRLPKFPHQPGSYDEKLTDKVSSCLAESWAAGASNHSKGPADLYGDVFDRALPEVETLFAKFLWEDVCKAALKEGFTVKGEAA